MNVVDRFFNRLMDFCMLLAKLMLLAMTIIICVHVFYRYALNRAIRWSEEITMMMMVYMGFFSIAYGVKHRPERESVLRQSSRQDPENSFEIYRSDPDDHGAGASVFWDRADQKYYE